MPNTEDEAVLATLKPLAAALVEVCPIDQAAALLTALGRAMCDRSDAEYPDGCNEWDVLGTALCVGRLTYDDTQE